jgi:hypothetical protein
MLPFLSFSSYFISFIYSCFPSLSSPTSPHLFLPSFLVHAAVPSLSQKVERSTLKCVLFRTSTQGNETWNHHGVRDGAPRLWPLEINHTAACPQSALSPRLMAIDVFTLVTLETWATAPLAQNNG